jgi:transcriptional regulator with XRE-family HTH domain
MPAIARPKDKQPKQPKRSIGENILYHRKLRGHSQLELAHLIGLKGDDAGAHIARLELGKQKPRWTTLQRLCKALGVKISEMVS